MSLTDKTGEADREKSIFMNVFSVLLRGCSPHGPQVITLLPSIKAINIKHSHLLHIAKLNLF